MSHHRKRTGFERHIIKGLHFAANLFVGMDYSGDIIDRAMLTVKVALVRDDDRSQNRLFLSK